MAGCRRRAPGDHPAPSAARLPACRVKRRTCPTCSCAPSRPSGGPAGCPGLSSPVPSPSKEARSQSRRSSPFSSPSKGSSWKPLASVPPLTEPSPPPWGCVYRLRSHVVSPATFSCYILVLNPGFAFLYYFCFTGGSLYINPPPHLCLPFYSLSTILSSLLKNELMPRTGRNRVVTPFRGREEPVRGLV